MGQPIDPEEVLNHGGSMPAASLPTSPRNMDPQTKLIFTILAQALLLFPPSAHSVAEDDVHCLESIKESLQDPDAQLSSWNFTANQTTGFICRFSGVLCWHVDENRVLSLELRDMRLRGNFPRGLEYCRSLVNLDLSGNQLSGSIPSDMCQKLGFLTSVDLSNNNFSGEIPASISDCIYLYYLALNDNNLSEGIPESMGMLKRIKYFNVSNNQLVGEVPPELAYRLANGAENYANNKELCGGPLGPCEENDKDNHSSTFMVGFSIGWIVSAVLFSASLVLFQPPMMIISKLADYFISVFSTNKRKWRRR